MPKVKIYTTPSCPYCKQAKEYFEEHDISFEEFNVAKDREKAKEMIEKTDQRGVPVISVGEGEEEELVVGFDKKKLKELLEL